MRSRPSARRATRWASQILSNRVFGIRRGFRGEGSDGSSEVRSASSWAYFGHRVRRWQARAPRASLIPPRRAAGRIGNAAVVPLEGGDARDLLVAQREIKGVEVLRNTFCIRGARDGGDAVFLQQPPQRYLRNALAPGARDLRQHRIAEDAPARKRAIGDVDQPALPARLQQLRLIEIGVVLRLQRHQRLGTEGDRLVE